MVQEEPVRIQRETPRCPGIYVKGDINGTKVWFTIDTGASRTIVSKRVFDKITQLEHIDLQQTGSRPLEQADGNILPEFGSSELQLELGTLKLNKEVTIAQIKDDALIGMDIGNMDVLSSQGTIIIDQHTIPTTIISPDNTRQVRTTEVVTIPGLTESIISVEVESKRSRENKCEDLIIEPNKNFVETYSALMATSLVTISNDQSTKVRVMNPGVRPIQLRSGACIGIIEAYENDIHQIFDKEDEMEEMNNASLKRLKFKQEKIYVSTEDKDLQIHGKLKHTSSSESVRQTAHKTIPDTSDSSLLTTLPVHLTSMFQRASKEWSHTEQIQLQELLIEYQDTFSRNDNDLGCTSLVEHSIETGSA
jgi:hypothetical protein